MFSHGVKSRDVISVTLYHSRQIVVSVETRAEDDTGLSSCYFQKILLDYSQLAGLLSWGKRHLKTICSKRSYVIACKLGIQ